MPWLTQASQSGREWIWYLVAVALHLVPYLERPILYSDLPPRLRRDYMDNITFTSVNNRDVLETANTPIMSSMPETLKRVVLSAKDEVGRRQSAAATRLWKARMEVQYAENEVRVLDGLPEKEIHGCSGDLDRSEYDGF